MRTSEFLNLVGTTRDTLRFYEHMKLIVPIRTKNNYREYSLADQKTYLIISNLRQAGLSISEIKLVLQLRNRPITETCHDDTVSFLQQKKSEFETQCDFYQKMTKISEEMLLTIEESGDKNLEKLIAELGTI